MDSRSRLDYAMFQLTPTRTRCDLVICAGIAKEKLASGLLEPFLGHLKVAREQITKGGYSINLFPSSPSSSWFTKSTLQRFVKFVNNPEILERFVKIDIEIAQIDYSITQEHAFASETYRNKSVSSYELRNELKMTGDAAHEEDSKVNLQRVLEARKAVLQKEQAMVYTRALVAGFEMDYLGDLICFADAFGSPRLREACLNFMDLCNKKSNDGVWMDEVAAMQAYSRSQFSYLSTSGGVTLAGKEDDGSEELTTSLHNGDSFTKKQNGTVDATGSDSSTSPGRHLPQHMHNYLGGLMFQHTPSYPGHLFPSMGAPPHYQGNLPWPLNVAGFRSGGNPSPTKRSRALEKEGNFDSSESSSGSDSDKYRKSSSEKVFIRNINCILSKRDGETESESDGNSSHGAVKHCFDNTVVSNPEGQKGTEQWNIFENLLLRDADQDTSADMESEKVKKPVDVSCDPFDLTQRDCVEDLRAVEDSSPVIKKYNTSEELFSHKIEESQIGSQGTSSEHATESPTTRRHKGDWFMGSLQCKDSQEKRRDTIFDDHFQSFEGGKDILVEESLDVQARCMIAEDDKLKEKAEATCVDPDDLNIVLERATPAEGSVATLNPALDYGNSNKIKQTDSIGNKELTSGSKETNSRSIGGPERKVSTIEVRSKAFVRSLGKKSDIISRIKKSEVTKTIIQKSKSEKEEEKRKNMEELLIQRQKRITERSASNGKIAERQKLKHHVAYGEEKKSNKQVLRSSTINRLSAPRLINPKVSPIEVRNGNKPKKGATTRTTRAENKKVSSEKVKPKDQVPSGEAKNLNKQAFRSSTINRFSAAYVINPEVSRRPTNKPRKGATTNETGVSRASVSQRIAGAENKKVSLDKVKPKDHVASQDARNSNKQVPNSSIDRVSALRAINPKVSPHELKPGNRPRKATTTKDTGVLHASLSQRRAGVEKKRASLNKVKPKDQVASQEVKRSNKQVLRRSTIDPLSANHIINHKVPPTKAATKKTSFLPAILSQRTAGAENKKAWMDEEDSMKIATNNSNGWRWKERINGNLHSVSSSVKKTQNQRVEFDPSAPRHVKLVQMKGESKILTTASAVLQQEKVVIPNRTVELFPDASLPTPASANKSLSSTSFNNSENGGAKEKLTVFPETSEISTLPPVKDDPRQSHRRKKYWTNGETSSKAATAFRKLFVFW